jgi:hypothetical protein
MKRIMVQQGQQISNYSQKFKKKLRFESWNIKGDLRRPSTKLLS